MAKSASPIKIINCKVENGKTFYHVKWDSSWEPEENLHSFQHLIDDFWEFIDNCRHASGQGPKPKKRKLDEPAVVRSPCKQQIPVHANLNSPLQAVQTSVEMAPVNQFLPTCPPMMPVESQMSQSPNQNTPNYSGTPPSRGKPRGRGGRGRGSRGGHTTPIKTQLFNANLPDVKTEFSPIDEKPLNLASFPFPTDDFRFNETKMDAMSMINHSPIAVSPRGRGRGRGRGNALATNGNSASTGTPIKEEIKSDELNISLTPSKKQPVNQNTTEWSNPYAKIAYICRYCSKEQPSGLKQNWKTHYESHFDIKNFGCYICEKRFRLKGDLKTHITRVHKQGFIDSAVIKYDDSVPVPEVQAEEGGDGLPMNPYVKNNFLCKVCNKELLARSRGNWKTHFESHLNLKPFSCYVCFRPFRLKGDLKTHITRVHKQEFLEDQVILNNNEEK